MRRLIARTWLRGWCFPVWNDASRRSWMFQGAITAAEIAAIRFGDEGQGWRMMPVAEFTSHPRAVPHFQQRVQLILAEIRPEV